MIKTELSTADKYTRESYDKEGVYKNFDEHGLAEIMVVFGIQVWSLPIQAEPVIQEMIDDYIATNRPEEPEESVSESFALKMLAVAQGNVKQIEL